MQASPFVDIHTHHFYSINDVISILNCFPNQIKSNINHNRIISLGLHPWHINEDNLSSMIHLIESVAHQKEIVAIGEVGLDRTINIPLDIQKKCFLKQIEIAESVNKPVIIHCVKCFSELLSIKKKIKAVFPWIIHGFRGNNEIAFSLLKQACYLSFGEALLFDKKNQYLFKQIPINQIFLETDESEYSIVDIYNKAASLRGISLDDFKERLFNNYKTIFNTIF